MALVSANCIGKDFVERPYDLIGVFLLLLLLFFFKCVFVVVAVFGRICNTA